MEATHVGRNRNRIYCPNCGTEWFVDNDDEYINEGCNLTGGALSAYDAALIWASHGKDVGAEKINIKCTSDYLQVTLLKDLEQYLGYHKTSRFTIGEESDAIEAFAESTDFIYTDSSTYANLQDGMIMMIEEGTGEYSLDSGPVIN